MWTQEVKKRAINSIYYRKGGKAVALISEGTLIDVQAYPAQQHLMKGEGGAGIQPTLHFPKPCTLAWGCVSPVSASAVIHMLSVSLHTAFRLSVCLVSSIYLFIFKDFFF